MILEDYIDRMNKSDFAGIAALFTDDCHFNDGGARPLGVPDLVVDGRAAVKEAFKTVWQQYQVQAKIIKLNPSSMEYDVFLGEVRLPCVGCATLKDGLIAEYVVRPR